MHPTVRDLRVRALNSADFSAEGKYVLYWMTAARRSAWNEALDRAVEIALEHEKPLLVFEPLRIGYRWASDRFHRFVIDGMQDNAAAFDRAGVTYLSYVEPEKDDAKGLLSALASEAVSVVTDDFPCFMLPAMTTAAARRVEVRFEAVDNNGVLPMRAAEKVFSRAFDFRRFLQKNLAPFLDANPLTAPLRKLKDQPRAAVAKEYFKRWPALQEGAPENPEKLVGSLDIDHEVFATATPGGRKAGLSQLDRFLESRLDEYGAIRNQPQSKVTSELSPYLHFGHVSGQEVVHALLKSENWDPSRLSSSTSGKRSGWWGCSESAEAFLDQIVTWRELGYNMTSKRDDYDQYESLPDWARTTMEEHQGDPRTPQYSLETMESAQTHDELWNAAQVELVREGRIHNYLRMLWGKKIFEWAESPRKALDILIELNNKYALDGRNPNSYSGIFWTLGRYDRAWGPERPIFGKIRYMSSENTARKVRVKDYIASHSLQGSLFDEEPADE